MNEARVIHLAPLIGGDEGWSRSQGREVAQRVIQAVEENPGTAIFKLSLEGMKRMDISFADEAIIETARRYRKAKGFCLMEAPNSDIVENIEAAAQKREQPMMLWSGARPRLIGPKPSEGLAEAFEFALKRPQTRAADFAAAARRMSITNASTKFKQLWEQGYLLRSERSAETGGIEYIYQRIG